MLGQEVCSFEASVKRQYLGLYFTLEAGSGHKVCKTGKGPVLPVLLSPLPLKSGFSPLTGTAQLQAGIGYVICNCDTLWKSNLNLRARLCFPILKLKWRKHTFGS